MRSLVLFALFSLASAKPWGGYSSVGLVQQPVVAHQAISVAQPVVAQSYAVQAPVYSHAPAVVAQPVVHAAPAATSYSSFQRVIHPVSVAHAPVVQTVAQPLVQTVAQPIVQTVAQHVVSQPVVQTVAHTPVVQSVAQPVYAQSYGHPAISVGHGW